ncbi:NifB/NifX family molybdenum-iron cluster-binding protein [Treponema sp.]|uniref:NifB/NifX family molybdenum-iron cluster-binding protein n=1 Tax=Treponema sp. TaxID=166 RepID=UPI003F02299C
MFISEKGEKNMRIAVTYENGKVFQHFGHTEQFKLYDCENDKVIKEQIVDTNGQGHGALSEFLGKAGVDILICGGIGSGAQSALSEAGIQLYGGVSGNADNVIKAYLEGNLTFDPNVQCDHHEHHHEDGHSCGEDKHGCKGK